ncbi:hypothetical protein KCP73_05860 [Salmonella enterica subsp. enterica]|nr:hypothetical protein KCP73_05860 [Salmonella enterica subsp. enterica]
MAIISGYPLAKIFPSEHRASSRVVWRCRQADFRLRFWLPRRAGLRLLPQTPLRPTPSMSNLDFATAIP